jgi:histidinol-phosphate aminotransferase
MEEHGLELVVKLASNENPLGPSPKAVEEMRKTLWEVHYYPNGGRTLREAIAADTGLAVDQVIAGSGSEGVMNTFMRTFFEPGDEVVTSAGTFTGFYVLSAAKGLRVVTAPMKDFAYDLDAILDRVTPQTRLVYIANPNNPTGSVFGKARFEAFYRKLPKNVLVMHDEAYYDFAAADTPDFYTMLTDIRPNVITLRTFSKSHGLAGIRIGYATAPSEIISPMLKVKLPFEPSVTAQAAGLGALEDDEFLQRSVQTNLNGKRYLEDVFRSLGLSFVPTAANFFCLPLTSEEDALSLTAAMEQRGVIIRPLAGFGLPNCVRISIGTEEQNQLAAHALREILELQEKS